MSSETSLVESSSNVVDLGSFRKKKIHDQEVARGRNPLYVSHQKGTISNASHPSPAVPQDMGDRLQRIRSSLQKINQLMSELRKMSDEKQTNS